MANDKKKRSSDADDLLADARRAFETAQDAESENRSTALEDIRFAREGVQWPDDIRKQREIEGRPCLTINKLPTFLRQVVNDARQNKPSIKVHPADSGADPDTAEVINGLIRNIEYTSNADVAYDTGTECAVGGGFGYWRVVLDYAFDDSFDMDIKIARVANQFSVYGDPNSTAADSSDWNSAFVVDRLTKKQYEATYNGKAPVDWDDDAWSGLRGTDWVDDREVMIAEWWKREQVDREILMFTDLRNGETRVMAKDEFEASEDLQQLMALGLLEFKQARKAKSHEVTQYKLSGAEVLSDDKWPGRFIPIIPVYGDEFDIQGKRFFRSLIHDAIDPQRSFNYWRSAATELVALAPKTPYIGKKGAFDHDIDRWNTANTRSHPFLEYTGEQPPQRQPLDMGTAAGALQEALNASDDIKAVVGMYDASLGARSNETSGRAIMARQREGDVSTFHFVDNMARAIRHTGRVIIDLLPHVYSGERIVRVLGEDGSEQAVKLGQPFMKTDPKTGQPMLDETGNAVMALHDLTAGKYDLTVTTGPSFTTRREEAAVQMTELIRAFPQAAPIVAPELAKNLDWPGADKIAEKMEALEAGGDPEAMQKQMQDMQGQMQQLAEENQKLKADKSEKMAEIESDEAIQVFKVQSEEKIAKAKIDSQQQIEFYKAQAQAGIAARKAEDAHTVASQKASDARDIATQKAAQPKPKQAA